MSAALEASTGIVAGDGRCVTAVVQADERGEPQVLPRTHLC
jgi:hypothetical protein